MGKHKGLDVNQFVHNCVPSVGTETDWTLEDAVQAKAISLKAKVPETVDLRENWWKIRREKSASLL